MHIEFVEIGNFRKLLGVRIVLSKEKTVFVGANNSGKTSAMVALRHFLVERERNKFSLNDFTLSHWPIIDAMGQSWEDSKAADQELALPDWTPILPFVDLWLSVTKAEAHYVQKLIPTLDWDGGLLGVRLRFEPRDSLQLQKDYLAARDDAKTIQAVDTPPATTDSSAKAIMLWPKSLTEYLQRRLSKQFTVRAYILDPAKIADPKFGVAQPQIVPVTAEPVDGEPFKGLIRIDEISAQRGFGQSEGSKDPDDDNAATGASGTRRMSDQLRRYWNRHLDPYENPDAQDLQALKAIETAQKAFDDRLREGFAPALEEVQGLGYPGVTDPRLNISTRLKPVDGLNHEAAVQYMIQMVDGEHAFDLNLPEDSNGLGYQNLISMVFRLMSFRDAWMRVGKANSSSDLETDMLVPPLHLVLIEEPEAHLHTQVQQVFIRQAYKILRKHKELGSKSTLSTQMVVSTHSSHVAHECDFDALRYFRRLPSEMKSVPTSCVVNLGTVFGTDIETKRFVTRYLNVTHCDLFFADAAVLVEGPAERVLVPYFVSTQPELADLAECYVTWLEIGGSHAHRLRSLIEHLGLTTLVVTDLDAMTDARISVPPKRGAKQKSRNATLSGWWPASDDLDTLLDVKPEAKIKNYKDERFGMRVAYQSPVQVQFKGVASEAVANTLEDALVFQNLDYFATTTGKGLFARFKASIAASGSIGELGQKLFDDLKSGGKAEFALDLLEIEDPKALQAPHYIKEGLLWLSTQLRKQQQELGVATSALTPEPQNAKAAA
ncbi:AAA family ATPase [Rhizobium sp. CF142]|uniref:AAA family ATPase n=1 Tax=Rhizobium sp. CF142 TaxID=1144314 RepID=UPI00026F02CB|nr:AAA family ATPase [Rhizobium sp. CF142]EJJ27305.1 putative ATP-dependent endonuclease of the OLD family [Rhizobium sp. CF142]